MRYLILVVILVIGISLPIRANPNVYKPNVYFAKDVNPNDIYKIDPRLREVVDFVSQFCVDNEVKFMITSMIRSKERNIAVGAKSVTHTEARAVDFSIKPHWGWNDAKLAILLEEVQMRYNFIGAISVLGKKRTIMLVHSVGTVAETHAHLQVDRPKTKGKK